MHQNTLHVLLISCGDTFNLTYMGLAPCRHEFSREKHENSWYYLNCLSVLVWSWLKLANAVILAEVNQCCTALNGKQRPRPVLYYNMALIKTRLVCLRLVLSRGQCSGTRLLTMRYECMNVNPHLLALSDVICALPVMQKQSHQCGWLVCWSFCRPLTV